MPNRTLWPKDYLSYLQKYRKLDNLELEELFNFLMIIKLVSVQAIPLSPFTMLLPTVCEKVWRIKVPVVNGLSITHHHPSSARKHIGDAQNLFFTEFSFCSNVILHRGLF